MSIAESAARLLEQPYPEFYKDSALYDNDVRTVASAVKTLPTVPYLLIAASQMKQAANEANSRLHVIYQQAEQIEGMLDETAKRTLEDDSRPEGGSSS